MIPYVGIHVYYDIMMVAHSLWPCYLKAFIIEHCDYLSFHRDLHVHLYGHRYIGIRTT